MLTDAATRTPFTRRANLIMLTTYPRESVVITDLNFRIYSLSEIFLACFSRWILGGF